MRVGGSWAVAVALGTLIAGCGSRGTPKLTPAERYEVSDAEASLGALTLNGSEPGHARATERQLLALCDRKRKARYDQRTVGEVAGEVAEDLSAHTYGAWAQELRDHCKQ